ncbi:MAG: chemotaxis protein [Syntrophobacteraceae bacterium]|jgi:two-component system chemotaxis response regulator CheV
MAQNTGILLATGTNEMEIVEFYLDESLGAEVYRGCYGINVAKVVEIIRKPKVTFLPQAPRGFLGTFLSRNRVIPLIDLAVQLGKTKPEEEVTPLTIVTEFNKSTLAFVVSGVNRIHRLEWGQIEPGGPILDGMTNSITGIVKMADRNLLILDMEKILAELNPQYAIRDDVEMLPVGVDLHYKALIADDSSSIRKILSRKLEQAGFTIRMASDGSEAWECLKELKTLAQKEKRPIHDYIDIVISDIEMPQMDGYSLCHSVKQDQVLKALPVVLFSSLINEKLIHKGQSVGADEQITKPEAASLARRAGELIEQYRNNGAH